MSEYTLAAAFWSTVVATSVAAPLLFMVTERALHAMRDVLADVHHAAASIPSNPRPGTSG